MNHRDELLRLLEADLDGEIGAEDRLRLEAGLRDHPELAEEVAELRRLRAVFRAVPAVTAPDGFAGDVVAVTAGVGTTGVGATAPESRGRFRILRAAPWIAGLAAAGLLAVMLGPWADDVGRFAERGAPTETADAPDLEARGTSRELLDRSRSGVREQVPADEAVGAAPAKRISTAPSESLGARSGPVADLEDARDVSDRLRSGGANEQDGVDAEESGLAGPVPDPDTGMPGTGMPATGKRKSASGARRGSEGGLRKSSEEAAQGEPSDAAPSDPPAPIRAPATTTATAPAAPPVPEPEPGTVRGGGGGGDDGGGAAPAPHPVRPAAPTAAAGESAAAADVPALGDRADSMDVLLEAAAARAAPTTRRYVVFEDEAAARRFVTSLRTLAEKKAEVGAGGDFRKRDGDGPAGAKKDADGPVADAGAERERGADIESGAGDGGPDDVGGPTTGGVAGGPSVGGGSAGGGAGAAESGRSLSSGTSFAAGAAPRVLERLALATSDPAVGRVFARAPVGGVFGEDVPAGLLEAAEARFKLAVRERRSTRPDTPGAEEGVAVESAEPEAPASAKKPAAATRSEAGRADVGALDGAGKSKNVGARVEIVVVIVPKGTLPAGTLRVRGQPVEPPPAEPGAGDDAPR